MTELFLTTICLWLVFALWCDRRDRAQERASWEKERAAYIERLTGVQTVEEQRKPRPSGHWSSERELAVARKARGEE